MVSGVTPRIGLLFVDRTKLNFLLKVMDRFRIFWFRRIDEKLNVHNPPFRPEPITMKVRLD
jgi:hypothetical protein